MIEDYANYELSQALKTAGFNEPCFAQWAVEPDGLPVLMGTTTFAFSNRDCQSRDVAAPFLWQAQKWLRDIHHIDINIDLDDETDEPYTAEIYKDKKCVVGHWELGFFATYEQALSAGLFAALELIKEGARNE